MKFTRFKSIVRLGTLALVMASLAGCLGGDDGNDGAPAAAPPPAVDGKDGKDGVGAANAVKVSAMTAEQWAELTPKGEITGVTIQSPPVVSFKVTDAEGNPIVGLGNTRQRAVDPVPTYLNLAFTIAKLVPANAATGTPSKWVNYIVTTAPTTTTPAALTRPSTDNNGTLVDNGDGTYKYTFSRDITKVKEFADATTDAGSNKKADLGDLTYEPNLTHRLVIQLSGSKFGTGTNTATGADSGIPAVAMNNPQNIIYDFIPATGQKVSATNTQREIVKIENCNECHGKLAFHGGSRTDTKYCVTCHTDQRKFGRPEAAITVSSVDMSNSAYRLNGQAAGDFTRMVHQIHQGHSLTKTGYDYAGVKYNDLGYSMLGDGQKMCIKCHDGSVNASKVTAQGNNWKEKPSRLACGSCHDQVNFETGEGHGDGSKGVLNLVQLNDASCSSCHTNTGIANIADVHRTENVTKHNPTVAAGLANFTYDITSAAVTGTTATVKFKISQSVDGSAASAVTLNAPAAGLTASLAGFTGGPSFLLAYAMPQSGITPVDYNNLGIKQGQPKSVAIANLLNTSRTDGSITGPGTGPDAGVYTATINNAFPAGSNLRSVALQGYYTQVSPAAARHTISVVKAVTGDTARRSVVDPNKCSNCHEWFEGHGGNRVFQTQVCVMCHNPNLSTSGRGISDTALNAYAFTTADTELLTRWGIDKTKVNAALDFPVTSNTFKDMIHGVHAGKSREMPFRDARDRTPAAITLLDMYKLGFPGILNNCQTCHTAGTYGTVPSAALASTHEAKNAAYTATPTTVNAKASLDTVGNNADDIVTTPYAAACVSCHDNAAAKSHMSLNGGQILVSRAVHNSANESCAVCHSNGSTFDVDKVHNK